MSLQRLNSIEVDNSEGRYSEAGVNDLALAQIIERGVLPAPITRVTEQLDDNNRDLPGSISVDESGRLMKNYLAYEGFGSFHADIHDNWLRTGAYNNIFGRQVTFKTGNVVCFENLFLVRPTITPQYARTNGLTYSTEWQVDAVERKRDCMGDEVNRFGGSNALTIGHIPLMLRTQLCVLYNKTDAELAALGEDPKDPIGYFIVDGYEKIPLMQEQLAINKIILMNLDIRGNPVVRMTANTVRGTALIQIGRDPKTKIIELRLPSIRVKVGDKREPYLMNVLRIFRIYSAMYPDKIRLTTEREISAFIGQFTPARNRTKVLLGLSSTWLEYFASSDDRALLLGLLEKGTASPADQTAAINRVLATDLYPHLNDIAIQHGETPYEREVRIAWHKLLLYAIMNCQYLEYLAGYRPLHRRDEWSNKRTENGPRLMAQLLRNAWHKLLGLVQGAIDEGRVRDLPGVVAMIKARNSIITDTFRDSFVTNNWGVKNSQMKNNVAQTLVRDNIIATISHVMTIDVSINRTDRQPNLRQIQNGQYGFICAVSASEGQNCGILKVLTVLTRLSLEQPDTKIMRYLVGDLSPTLPKRLFSHAEANQFNVPISVLTSVTNRWDLIGFGEGAEINSYLQSLVNSRYLTATEVRLTADGLFIASNDAIIPLLARPQRVFPATRFMTSVNINGQFAGYTDGVQTSEYLRSLVDSGQLPPGTGVVLNGELLDISAVVTDDLLPYLNGDPTPIITRRVFLNPTGEQREILTTHVIANGKYIGLCDGAETRNFLVGLRRSRELPQDMSVILDGDWLHVDISPSRPIRPLLIVDVESQVLMIDKLGLRGRPAPELLANGVMEYISAWEQEFIQLAYDADSIVARLAFIQNCQEQVAISSAALAEASDDDPAELEQLEIKLRSDQSALDKVLEQPPYTHCELDPQATLGISAVITPFSNMNQAPRNTYQSNMGKQALHAGHSNQMNRMSYGENKVKTLAFPHESLVQTEMYDVLGLNQRGQGQNAIVAFMAWPNTEEDAFVINQDAIDNGMFRMIKHTIARATFKQGTDVTESLARPTPRSDQNPNRTKNIGKNGLPFINAYLKQGDYVIGKQQVVILPDKTREEHDNSVIMKVGEEGIVERVLVTTDYNKTFVSVKLRITRQLQWGDKLAPRNAQKGTIGQIEPGYNLPFTAAGLVPDMIVHPGQIPSRMTMSYPREMFFGKAGVLAGQRVNGSSFRQLDMKGAMDTLHQYGYHSLGVETMYSGTTGRPLKALIMIGPVHVQILRHNVADKVGVRARGVNKPMTRQPIKGRAFGGGLRFGEMEKNATISHGASSVLLERLCRTSDAYQAVFCLVCGCFATNDVNLSTYKCPACKNNNNFGRVTIPYILKYLTHLLAAPGYNLRPVLADPEAVRQMVLESQSSNIITDDSVDPINEQDSDDEFYQDTEPIEEDFTRLALTEEGESYETIYTE